MSEKPDEPPTGVIDRDTVRELFEEGVPVTYITRDKVVVAGQVCDVVETGSAEDVMYVICAVYVPWVNFPHSVIDQCSRCGVIVVVRNHAPKTPARLCVPCAVRQGFIK